METANLTAVSQQVNYGYYFGQLMQIDYPQNPENNVSYAYGVSGNEAGRISKSQDASGVHAYEYGNMGELVKKISTGVVPVSGGETYSFATRWEYDSWNRIRTIQYPDGELVAYDYDNGGQLIHMQGNKATAQNYVNNILYNEFGSRTYFEYGHGVYSNYIYNSATRWLQNLTTTSTNGSLHNITYTYDSVGNRAWTLRRSPAQAPAGEMTGAVGAGLETTMHVGDCNYNQAIQSAGFAVAGKYLPRAIKIGGLGGEVPRQGTALKVDGASRLLNSDK